RGGKMDRFNPFHATMLRLERQTFCPACTGWIIANSRRGKEEIVRHYGFPEDRIEVIYNGVDLARFRADPRTPALSSKGGEGAGRIAKEALTLLFVGTGFERKGLAYCIRALANLPGNFNLRVVGK